MSFEILGEENENRGLHERNSASVLLQLCALVLNDTGRRQKSEREKQEHRNTDATEALLEAHCVEEFFRVESAEGAFPRLPRRIVRESPVTFLRGSGKPRGRSRIEVDRGGGVTGQRETSAD